MSRATWGALATLLVVAAAGTAMHRVFLTPEWRTDAVLALIAAVAIATVARQLRGSAGLAAAVSAVALVTTLTLLYAADAGPWPGPAAWVALWNLLREALVELRLQPAPTEPLESLRLLVTGGTWIVAHVTHEALVRVRRPGLALLAPGLLWLVPLAVPMAPDSPWPHTLPFLAAAAVVLLLEPNLDLAGWTREDDRPRLSLLGLGATATALLVAMIAPGLLPGYGADAWVDVTAPVEPRGYQPIVDIGDRLHLPSPRDVMLVQTNRRAYLRLAALETFDGRTWRLGPPDVETYRPDPDQLFRTDGPLPFETAIQTGERVAAKVEILDLENIYVPVPYQLDRITGPQNAGLFYSREGGFVATGDVADNELSGQTRVGVRQGFAYDYEAVIPTPSYADLAALGDLRRPLNDPAVALPGGYDEFAAETIRVFDTAGATTTIDQVLALQSWFIGAGSDFTYSIDVPELRGDDALRTFLFETRTGYCEYYATAMAVMLRAVGIPARVAVGFLPGRVLNPAASEGADATLIVSTTDAHAWVEVLFPGYGWLKLDPTPRSDGTTLPPTDDDLDPNPSLVLSSPTVTDTPTDAPTTATPTATPTVTPTTPDGAAAGGGADGPPLWVWLGVGVVLAVLAALALRRRAEEASDDPVTTVVGVQRRVLRVAARWGVGRRPAETVGEVAARWVREGRVAADDAITFAQLASAAAFGGHATDEQAVAARELEGRLLQQLQTSLSRRQRTFAPVRLQAAQVQLRAAALRQRLSRQDERVP
jgi:transglutaminase-like putative cysteine protease